MARDSGRRTALPYASAMLAALQLAAIAVSTGAVIRAAELRHQRSRRFWLCCAATLLGLGMVALLARSDLVCAKIIALVLMPAGLVWLLLAVCAVQAWRRQGRAAAAVLGALFLLHTLAGNVYLGSVLLSLLERGLPHLDAEQLAAFDAVCILGGGTLEDADGIGELGDGGDRLAVAAALVHSGKTPLVVASGTRIGAITGADTNLANETATLLIGLGVAPGQIIRLAGGPENTAQEVAAYKQLIAERGWKRVGLISSAWHLPRALRLCARIGLVMVPIPADHRNRLPSPSCYWLVPQEEGFSKIQHACWEWLGCWLAR
jgi:uncharacterized SAM-binding protein YcdF (DUF218 family)